MAFYYKVRNSDGTLGDMVKFGIGETAEEKAARLEQENQLLLSSIREISSYTAKQEQRLTEQEKGIMELSTLIANLSQGDEQGV